MISTPKRPWWLQTFTTRTGPIFVFPRIHPLTRDDSSLRGKVLSTWSLGIVIKYNEELSFLNVLRETSIGAELGQFLLCNTFLCTSVSVWEIDLAIRKFCRYNHWFQIISRGGCFTVTREFLAYSLHKSATAPQTRGWLTENKCAKSQFNGVTTTVEVNVFYSFSFAFQFSLFLMRCEHGIQDVRFRQSWASCHEQFSSILHQVCWHEFRTISSPIQALETINVLAWIFEHTQRRWGHSHYNLLCFLVFSNQSHFTLKWIWSFPWIALVHTLIQS